MKNAMRSATPHYTWIQGCYWMVYCILLSFSSVYLLEQGLSNTEIGLLLGLSGLASALLQPVAGARAGRMRRSRARPEPMGALSAARWIWTCPR